MNPDDSRPIRLTAEGGLAVDLGLALHRLRDRQRFLVLAHDNPDPDALAAAQGLALLFRRELGADVTVARGGIIGRAENRALVEALGRPMVPVESLSIPAFDAIALVDSQPETGNNSLPPDHPIDVVVDHHPLRPGSARAPWCDVRPELGATSTIVYSYLRERGIALDPVLATCFFYALRSETRDLGREATEAERAVYLELVGLVDHQMLYRISHPKVPREHFQALDRSLQAARVHGDIVCVNMGVLDYPDLVAEIADLLLALDGARYVLCMGLYEGGAYLSLRTEATEGRAGSIMRAVIGADGAAGGHGTMAGARLHAVILDERKFAAAYTRVVDRLCEHLGRPIVPGDPLVVRPR